MKIKALELRNVRGFKELTKTIFSDKINVFIGANNSGKSTILNSIFLMQRQGIFTPSDITIGQVEGEVKLFVEGDYKGIAFLKENSTYKFNLNTNDRQIFNEVGTHIANVNPISESEPHNIIYPYLSKRKSVNFSDSINQENTNSVLGNFSNLYSKIDRLITPQFQPGNSQYIKACKTILGFEISTLASPNGKKGVYFIHNYEHIPLTAMGEGVANIIGLVTDLCIAENKIFLIEEPENDIHPTALKALLNFITEKSETNQFFISTHSNIVMKYLGGISDAKLFNIHSSLSDTQKPNLFISNLVEVPEDLNSRMEILESLGYEFNDFGLWSGWLFLEESSAEVLIREWFIKWFVPKLNGKLRTFSSNSLSQVTPKFEDFNRLFVFLHLEPTYKNKVWVIIDQGIEEQKVVETLQEKYCCSGWHSANFSQFSEHDFEKYYPERFKDKVESILLETDKQKKRLSKKALLNEIKEWILLNEDVAKEEFRICADDVIRKLIEISQNI